MVHPGMLVQPAALFINHVSDDLEKTYKLDEKMIVYGFSGGGRDTLGLTMIYPEVVYASIVQCSGSIDSYFQMLPMSGREIQSAAKDVPLFVSCGAKDSKRLKSMRRFVAMYKKKFGREPHLFKIYANQGHTVGREQKKDSVKFLRKYMP